METTPERLEFRVGLFGAFIAPLCFLVGVFTYFVIFGVFDMNALTASGLAGLLVAALFAKPYARFWEAVISGVASRASVTLLMILLAVSLIAELISQTDVASGFIWLASEIGLNGGFFIPVIFLITCAISMSTGTSIGTLFTAFPIFYPAGVALGADPLLLAGAILSGALFGDNLAPISDSTVVSSSTQQYRTRQGTAEISGVVRSRAKYALTAAAVSFVVYLVLGPLLSDGAAGQATAMAGDASPMSLVMLGPVVLLLVVAFWKRDIFLATTVGLLSGIVVGLISGVLAPSEIISKPSEEGDSAGFLISGVAGILPLLGLGLVVFAIIGVIRAAGVFDMIVEWTTRGERARTARGAEAFIGFGAVVTGTVFAGVNGPCMMMFGPVADRIGAKANLHPYRRANIMDCFVLGLGCIVPIVSSFLLIASQLTEGHENVPSLAAPAIFITAVYPLVLTVVMVTAIVTGWGRRFEGPDGAEARTPTIDAEEPATTPQA